MLWSSAWGAQPACLSHQAPSWACLAQRWGQWSAASHALGSFYHSTASPFPEAIVAGLSADPEKSTTTGGWAGGEKGLLSFIEVSAPLHVHPVASGGRAELSPCVPAALACWTPCAQRAVSCWTAFWTTTDVWLLQAEQAASGASKTVMSEEDRKKAMTSEPKVMKQDGDTLYIGFDKGCAACAARSEASRLVLGTLGCETQETLTSCIAAAGDCCTDEPPCRLGWAALTAHIPGVFSTLSCPGAATLTAESRA